MSFEKVLCADSNSRDESVRAPHLSPRSGLTGATTPNEKLAGSCLFSLPSTKQDIRSYHPSTEVAAVLWDYYVDHVDILVKILYKPAVEALIKSASGDLKGIDASTETLLFAIYFATVTTMSAEECLRLQGEGRGVLLQRYRYALEQALAQASWMTTQEMVVLQAIILLIVSLASFSPLFPRINY